MLIRHKCDNRKCINPEHLLLGNYQDNVNDMIERNRNAIGEKNGMAKLTKENIKTIRKSTLSNNEIAKIFNVDPANIRQIKRCNTWKHVK